jgi:hypothetical protein
MISPADGEQGKVLVVKPEQIGSEARYTLFDERLEHLSLLQASSSAEFLLRDADRRVVGRFKPLGPGLVVLRSPVAVVARLRLTGFAAPAGLRVECDAEEGVEWLLAVLLYAIMLTEQMTRQGPTSESIRAILAQPATNQP